MYPILFMLKTLIIGTLILMLGILIFRESEQSFRSACKDCFGWGAGFFLSMGAQIVVLAAL